MNNTSKQKYHEVYSFVRKYDPQLYDRVVNISNVALTQDESGQYEFGVAAKIEKETMLLVYDLLNPNDEGDDF